MNIKLVTINRLKEFLNKFSKVATSGKYSDLSGVPTKVSQFTNDAGYAKTTDIPTYTAGEGIKIENGVISVIDPIISTRIDSVIYTAPGYTLYGDYFLSDTITANIIWAVACVMTNKNVIVTETITTINTYLFKGEETSTSVSTKTVTAKTLSKKELETLTAEQRKINENGHYWYWTSTPNADHYAWGVYEGGRFDIGHFSIDDRSDDGGARLGFKNPFI